MSGLHEFSGVRKGYEPDTKEVMVPPIRPPRSMKTVARVSSRGTRTRQRDRPLVKLHYVVNVEQTEGLQLSSLQTAAREWEGHERAEAPIKASGIRLDHVGGERDYYSLEDDRVVLPDRSQFPSQDAYTHTALHELGTPPGTRAG